MRTILLVLLFSLLCSSCAIVEPSIRDQAPAPVTLQGKVKTDDRMDHEMALFPVEDRRAQLDELLRDLDASNRLFSRRLQQVLDSDPSREVEQPRSAVELTGDLVEVSFNFYDADLVEVIRLFMHLLEDGYVLHPGVGGRVSLSVEDVFNRDQLLDLLEGVLRIHGAGIMQDGGIWEILPQSEMPRHFGDDRLVLFDNDATLRRGQIIQGFRLYFISAHEMSNILEPYLSKGAQVYVEEQRGILLVSDFPHVLRKVTRLVEAFDVSEFADIKIGVYTLRHMNAVDAIPLLEDAAKALGLNREHGGPFARVSFLPLERTNTLVVLARNNQVLELMEAWTAHMDLEIPERLQEQHGDTVFVYYVQYGRAEDIAASLSNLFSGRGGGNRASDSNGNRTGGNASPSTAGLFGQEAGGGSDTKAGATSTAGRLFDEVIFVVDETNNAILTRSTSAEYARILSVIEQLDQYPKQVLIEVVIAEVNLSEDVRLGVEWRYLFDMQRDFTFGSVALDSQLGAVGAMATPQLIGSGLTYMVQSSNVLKASLQALSRSGNAQILSTPTLLASDNKEATINIGKEVPIPTSTIERYDEVIPGRPSRETTIQYRNTGIIMKVTPQINKHGMVRMNITQEVSELLNEPVRGVEAPSISTRNAQTTVSVNDQQTIVIGGLIRQARNDAFSGVPGLNRIPILKYLFGYSANRFENSELMIFITPHVILSEPDSQFITRDFLARLEEVKAAMH
ncbi:type II secretion system secretin GspD [Desulfonatronum parangueonense]